MGEADHSIQWVDFKIKDMAQWKGCKGREPSAYFFLVWERTIHSPTNRCLKENHCCGLDWSIRPFEGNGVTPASRIDRMQPRISIPPFYRRWTVVSRFGAGAMMACGFFHPRHTTLPHFLPGNIVFEVTDRTLTSQARGEIRKGKTACIVQTGILAGAFAKTWQRQGHAELFISTSGTFNIVFQTAGI